MVHKLTTPLTVFLLTITGVSPQANAEDCMYRPNHLAAHPARGTAETHYYGVKDIDITKVTGERDEGGSELIWYELEDRGRNLCTSTFAGADLFGENRLLTSDDPHFDPNTDDDLVIEPAAVIGLDLHWAAAKAYDYFLEHHNWQGMSGDGAPVRLSVSYGDLNRQTDEWVEPAKE